MQQKKRITWFVIMIATGMGLGLLYGWIINPVKYVDTTADSLRTDYKTDYVLMVSEIYKMDGNLEQAIERLSLIDSRPAGQIAADGLLNARALGYTPSDLSQIETLAKALQTTTPTPPKSDSP